MMRGSMNDVSKPLPTLVVVGAALGSGRWLAEHVFPANDWARVYLIDSDSSKQALEEISWGFTVPIHFGRSDDSSSVLQFMCEPTRHERFTGTPSLPLSIEGEEVVVCLAVPLTALSDVSDAVLTLVPSPTAILVSTTSMAQALAKFAHIEARVPVIGVHALNDAAAPSALGQTIYVVPANHSSVANRWFSSMVETVGAIATIGSASEHDRTMAVVQALTHRTLIAFADAVIESGLHLEDDLWAARTPLFEALLSLSVRVLDTRQQATITATQQALSDAPSIRRLARALDRVPMVEPESSDVTRWIQHVREGFSGTFFESLRAVAAAAVSATQRQRSELAERLQAQTLVGLRRISGGGKVHIGILRELSSTSVSVEELVVGPTNSAALLFGSGLENVRRLGVVQGSTLTTLSLGHVALISNDDLERELDAQLGRIARDVRFLVPESVSGDGVLQAVSEMGIVIDPSLVDEVVRTGQRSVVIRLNVRADRSIETTIEAVREHVASVYRWPRGLTREVREAGNQEVVYLGPSGTFSEAAATQLASRLGSVGFAVRDVLDFDEVIREVANGSLGVLPISSSASGLVTRTVLALLDTRAPIVAGGVVDVAVRFDAYARPGTPVELLRGSVVYSHPQALAQCQSFVKRWSLRAIETSSTSAALEMVASSGEPAIALAGADKGVAYGLRIAEREVDDLSGSITRFLVIGRDGVFGKLGGGSAPTLRSVWVGSNPTSATALMSRGGAAFDEVLTDSEGNFALISSRVPPESTPVGCRYLGSVPWSPRTPIVRPDPQS
jgi:prephenate dehydratase/prephenate dehydrogenase